MSLLFRCPISKLRPEESRHVELLIATLLTEKPELKAFDKIKLGTALLSSVSLFEIYFMHGCHNLAFMTVCVKRCLRVTFTVERNASVHKVVFYIIVALFLDFRHCSDLCSCGSAISR